MTKLLNRAHTSQSDARELQVQSSNQPNELPYTCLSKNGPKVENSDVLKICCKSYWNNEVTATLSFIPENMVPPRKKGFKLTGNRLNRRAQRRIKKAVRFLEYEADKLGLGPIKLFTLTYSNKRIDQPSDADAKEDIQRFFRELKRKLGNQFHWIYTIERQLNHCLHFHYLTIIPLSVRKLLQPVWERVIRNRLKRQGKEQPPEGEKFCNVNFSKGKSGQTNAAWYISKAADYLIKSGDEFDGHLYAMAQMTSRAIKADVVRYEPKGESAARVLSDAKQILENSEIPTFEQVQPYRLLWTNQSEVLTSILESLRCSEVLPELPDPISATDGQQQPESASNRLISACIVCGDAFEHINVHAKTCSDFCRHKLNDPVSNTRKKQLRIYRPEQLRLFPDLQPVIDAEEIRSRITNDNFCNA